MDICSMEYRFVELRRRRAIGLCVGGSRKPLVKLVRDVRYPALWRLQYRGGELSDLMELLPAKGAALEFAGRYLRRGVMR